ncbi:unnamed protein product [Prorocentrum cordatum]|uniref:Alpha/beta hydrolase fold-3 domain-containing protein n=1 Tax=Prorocentrum cordatum TaxID=2364126 RepID=A0ABN9PSL2_9DINO|nr:unnamed protein product [Polarella glacialis]
MEARCASDSKRGPNTGGLGINCRGPLRTSWIDAEAPLAAPPAPLLASSARQGRRSGKFARSSDSLCLCSCSFFQKRQATVTIEVPQGSSLRVDGAAAARLGPLVLQAFYGAADHIWRPGREAERVFLTSAGREVTAEVRDLLPSGAVLADDTSFGDPASGREKTLVVCALLAFEGQYSIDANEGSGAPPGDDELGLPDGFNVPPARPSHQILRPDADPRLDKSLFVRYDPPACLKTGAIVVVLPGGNYDESDIHGGEGQPIAIWLTTLGITAVVLQYRCVSQGHFWPSQLEDWTACARAVARQAAAWGCDPARVGALGFSAGGHLAGYAALRGEAGARPGLQILIYPAVDTLTPRSGFMSPWRADQGYPPVEASLHLAAAAGAPPAFLAGIVGDECCPAAENTDLYAEALGRVGVPCEHVRHDDPDEEHGCGLKEWWSKPCEDWLRHRGWACAV